MEIYISQEIIIYSLCSRNRDLIRCRQLLHLLVTLKIRESQEKHAQWWFPSETALWEILPALTAQYNTFKTQFCAHFWPRSVQFSSIAHSCMTLCDPVDCSMPGSPVHHQLLEPTQSHVHRVGDAIQPSHPLSSPSPPAFNLSQHQGLFQWVSSSHQVAKVLEFQLQHQSFQWIFRTDFL